MKKKACILISFLLFCLILVKVPSSFGQVENFFTYEETDVDGNLDFNATHIDHYVQEDTDSYLNKTVVLGDYVWSFDFLYENISGTPWSWLAFSTNYAVKQDRAAIYTADGNYTALLLIPSAGTHYLASMNKKSATYSAVIDDLSVGTWYYATLNHTGTSLTLELYNDTVRTGSNLTHTRTITLPINETHVMLYPTQMRDRNNVAAFDLDFANFDLNYTWHTVPGLIDFGVSTHQANVSNTFYSNWRADGRGSEVLVDSLGGVPNNYTWIDGFYFSAVSSRGVEGQCFNVTGGNFYITRANFTLYDFSGTPYTTMYVGLWSMNVTEPHTFGTDAIPNKPWGKGYELANSEGIYYQIDNEEIEFSFTFNTSNRYLMQENTVYGVGVWCSGGTLSSGNALGIRGFRGEGQTHDGNGIIQYSNGWHSRASLDLKFAVYGISNTSGYDPTINMSYWNFGSNVTGEFVNSRYYPFFEEETTGENCTIIGSIFDSLLSNGHPSSNISRSSIGTGITLTDGVPFNVTAITIKLRKVNSPNCNLTVGIYEAVGSNPTSVPDRVWSNIENSSKLNSTVLGLGYIDYNFNFSGNFQMNLESYYMFQLLAIDNVTLNTNNYVKVAFNNPVSHPNPYVYGNEAIYRNNAWFYALEQWDMYFKLQGNFSYSATRGNYTLTNPPELGDKIAYEFSANNTEGSWKKTGIQYFELVGINLTFQFNTGGLLFLSYNDTALISLSNNSYLSYCQGSHFTLLGAPENSTYRWNNFTWNTGNTSINNYTFLTSLSNEGYTYFSYFGLELPSAINRGMIGGLIVMALCIAGALAYAYKDKKR